MATFSRLRRYRCRIAPVGTPSPASLVQATPYYPDSSTDDSTVGYHVTWGGACLYGMPGAGYDILRSTTGTPGSFTKIASVGLNTFEYDDTNNDAYFDPAQKYYYEVQTTQGPVSVLGYSSNGGGNAAPALNPNQPTQLTATADATKSVTNLTWQLNTKSSEWNGTGLASDAGAYSASLNNQDSGFEVERSTDGGANWSTIGTVEGTDVASTQYDSSTSATTYSYSFTDSSPVYGVTNLYRVVAYNDIGETPDDAVELDSAPSATVSDKPIGAPLAEDHVESSSQNAAGGFSPYVSMDGKAVTVSAANGVLSGDIDPQGLALHVASFTQPTYGSVTVGRDGSFTYTPNSGFVGTDVFTYTAANSAGVQSNVGYVSIDCYSPPPVVMNAAFDAAAGATESARGSLVAQAVQNPSGGALTAQVVGGPQHGSVSIGSDGTFTYTSQPGYTGMDQFQFVVNDGYNNSNVANIVILPPGSGASSAADPADPTTSLQNGYSAAMSLFNALSSAVTSAINGPLTFEAAATDCSTTQADLVAYQKQVQAVQSAAAAVVKKDPQWNNAQARALFTKLWQLPQDPLGKKPSGGTPIPGTPFITKDMSLYIRPSTMLCHQPLPNASLTDPSLGADFQHMILAVKIATKALPVAAAQAVNGAQEVLTKVDEFGAFMDAALDTAGDFLANLVGGVVEATTPAKINNKVSPIGYLGRQLGRGIGTFSGLLEGKFGPDIALGGEAVTICSGGVLGEVSIPAAVAGLAIAAHGVYVAGHAVSLPSLQIVNQTGAGGTGNSRGWISENQNGRSARAIAYQTQISGHAGQAYEFNGVEFDGVDSTGLLEAKGPGYAWAVENGEFRGDYEGAAEMVKQARRQVTAAQGRAITWHVAEPETTTAIQNLFNANGITQIKVVCTPPVP